jgi:hypothetical protein
MRPPRALLPLLTLLLTVGCARAVEVRSTAPSYPLNVQNTHRVDLIVSYDDGSGVRTLGTVQGRATERFIIAAPRQVSIAVQGRSADGAVNVGPFTVELRTGDAPTVVLR